MAAPLRTLREPRWSKPEYALETMKQRSGDRESVLGLQRLAVVVGDVDLGPHASVRLEESDDSPAPTRPTGESPSIGAGEPTNVKQAAELLSIAIGEDLSLPPPWQGLGAVQVCRSASRRPAARTSRGKPLTVEAVPGRGPVAVRAAAAVTRAGDERPAYPAD